MIQVRWVERALIVLAAVAVTIPGLGCTPGRVSQTRQGLTMEELVGFYSPKKIKILEFTRPRSFDDDLFPDGIEVSLRMLDGAGDSVKAFGDFRFELYEHRDAAANNRGNPVRSWEKTLATLKDQKDFWERVTMTYQFPLDWEGDPIAPQRTYVLVVIYSAEGGERLFDSFKMEFNIDRQEILDSFKGT
ncbi:MAG: hypothetical protein O7D94_01640 [Planctomycetota bacterium]|nr:hypothetical protein [Planctomycetota bacterium]